MANIKDVLMEDFGKRNNKESFIENFENATQLSGSLEPRTPLLDSSVSGSLGQEDQMGVFTEVEKRVYDVSDDVAGEIGANGSDVVFSEKVDIEFNAESLRKAVIMTEFLAPPVSKRKKRKIF